ncbi:MAG: peptide transporter, partial [Cupriavidus sp.]|nr:peptide transporter [Cupriavidus sp.]
MPVLPSDAAPRVAWLPSPGSWQYHLMLGAAGMLVLGPLGGVAAAYMNFSLGFFVGGQVLAGILGSVVTAGYGASGRHGANYIQTAAASVAGMGGMAVVLQAMAWLGMAQPPLWQLVLYLLCIGMFGVGVGMLYTPLLVDRMQLTFPSGLAVANILRALTDPALLRRSVARLGGGMALGLASGLGAGRVPWLA